MELMIANSNSPIYCTKPLDIGIITIRKYEGKLVGSSSRNLADLVEYLLLIDCGGNSCVFILILAHTITNATIVSIRSTVVDR